MISVKSYIADTIARYIFMEIMNYIKLYRLLPSANYIQKTRGLLHSLNDDDDSYVSGPYVNDSYVNGDVIHHCGVNNYPDVYSDLLQ